MREATGQVVRAWRVSFSALQPVRRVTIVTAERKTLEHVFAGETAVAAGNGCIGRLGVLWLLLGDIEDGRLPKSTCGLLWTPVTAHAHRVNSDGIDGPCDSRRNGLSRDQIGGNACCRDRDCEHWHVRHGLSPTFQMIAPDPTNQTAIQ